MQLHASREGGGCGGEGGGERLKAYAENLVIRMHELVRQECWRFTYCCARIGFCV